MDIDDTYLKILRATRNVVDDQLDKNLVAGVVVRHVLNRVSDAVWPLQWMLYTGLSKICNSEVYS